MFSTKAARMAPLISHLGKSINISLPKADVTVCSHVDNNEFTYYTKRAFHFEAGQLAGIEMDCQASG